jgi:putative ATP-dependent endonuclease of the OLD family
MRLSHIELTNFRSFGPETTRIEFPADENLLTIVGANNAGKSNLIDAIRLALGNLTRYDAQSADFHNLDLDNELTIELYLREPHKREDIFHRTEEIAGFRFRAWMQRTGSARGELKTENYCFKPGGETYVPAAAIPRGKGKKAPEDVETRRPRPEPARQIVRQLGPVHYLSPDLRDAFRVTGSGVLARLLDLYRDDFRSPRNTYKIPGKDEEILSIQAFERLSERLEEVLRTDKLRTIETTLSKNLTSFLGPDRGPAEVAMALPPPEELLLSVLRLRVRDEPESAVLPISRLGTGYRSLMRLAILQTYAELAGDDKPAIFVVEEPEAYLHPHLRRFFRRVLARLASAGHDVIAATHDPALVSIVEYPTVMRLIKDSNQTAAYRCTESLDFSYVQTAQKIRGTINSEMLFAKKVILCEGQDDVAAAVALLDRQGVDLDAQSISVIDCGGAGNLPDYVRLLDALKIECMAIGDGDSTKAAKDESVAKRVKDLKELAGERAFLFEEDVETALGAEKKKDNPAHLAALIGGLDLSSFDEKHEIRVLDARLTQFTS